MPNIVNLATWPLWGIILTFIGAALIIAVAGARLTSLADQLADVTGLGEALFGAVLLGGSTSLPGIITSVTTAFEGYPELAVSNAVGGIAAQTTFLAIADAVYRKANLEHAAASIENLMQGVLLSTLLAVPLIAMAGPQVSLFGIHPASVALVFAYAYGLRIITKARSAPLWTPYETKLTILDKPEAENLQGKEHLRIVWGTFAGLVVIVGVAGFVVAQMGIALVDRTVLSESIIGGLFTAVATSLPELVISVTAVRRGALTLAVGGVIGGNSFDVLFIAFADVAFRGGSIYHAITNRQVFIIALTLILTSILLLGLLRREKKGIANIGFESFLVLVLYVGAFLVLFFL